VSTRGTPNREDPPEVPWAACRQSKTIPDVSMGKPTASLPEHLNQNISVIKTLHARAELDVSQHHRTVEAESAFFGRPVFFYSILLVVALWVLPNVLPRRNGVPRFEPPTFNWLEQTITLSSLLMTTGVMIKQNRQGKLAKQRAQLSLQLNLLSEQKIAFLTALVEELHCELPNGRNQYNSEAGVMKEVAESHAVMNVLEETLAEELAEQKNQETSG